MVRFVKAPRCSAAVLAILLAGAMAASEPEGPLLLAGKHAKGGRKELAAEFLSGGAETPVAFTVSDGNLPWDREALVRKAFLGTGLEEAQVPFVDLGVGECRGVWEGPNLEVIAGAGSLWFEGGHDPSLIWCLERAKGNEYAVPAALRERFASGAATGGNGAGAQMLGKWWVQEGENGDSLRFGGQDFGMGSQMIPAPGLGFWDEGVVELDPLSEGHLARLVALCFAREVQWGMGLEDGSAAWLNPEQTVLEVVGQAPVILVDAGPGERRAVEFNVEAKIPPGFEYSNVRLSILMPGDRVDLATGKLVGTESEDLGPNAPRTTRQKQGMGDAWRPGRTLRLVESAARLPENGVLTTTSLSGRTSAEVRFSRDEETRVLISAKHPQPIGYTVWSMRLDIGPSRY